jgi:hypothetical protein
MRGRVMWVLAAATLVLGVAQLPELRTMSSHGAGILDFEFVRTTARAHEILSGWGHSGRSAARTSLWIDYGYLIAYSLLLSLGCAAVGDRFARAGRAGLARAGAVLAWAALGAGLFDAIENAALLRILSGHTGQPYPAVASVAAACKFALLAVSLAYALGGWLASRSGRLGGAKAPT